MSREIKFRAWIKSENKSKYIIGFILDPEDSIIRIWWSQGLRTFNKSYPIENITLEQYTGLKDKNGKEIYEGDKITIESGKIFTVLFKDSAFGYYGALTGDFIPLLHVKQTGYHSEIIGNIHEETK